MITKTFRITEDPFWTMYDKLYSDNLAAGSNQDTIHDRIVREQLMDELNSRFPFAVWSFDFTAITTINMQVTNEADYLVWLLSLKTF